MSFSARPGRFGATVYNTLFAREGVDAVYLPRAAPARAEQIVECVRWLDLAGCSVSSPHKAAVLGLLDGVEDEAERAGAINTIYRGKDGKLVGACTDIDGVAGALQASVRDHGVRRAVVFGSGGVVGPCVVALRRLGIEDVRVSARNVDAGQCIAARHGVRFDPVPSASDLVINATPAGADSAAVPGLTAWIESTRVFLDMTVAPAPTPIVAFARANGLVVHDGVDMCTAQITTQAARYLGRPIDPDVIRGIVVGRYLSGS